MDNLGSHKSAALRRIIKAAGTRLWYLAPYSPDLNPIEQAFAKTNLDARRLERTIDDTRRHTGRPLATISPDECNNCFVNAGYASVKI
jgi:transposase